MEPAIDRANDGEITEHDQLEMIEHEPTQYWKNQNVNLH